MISGYRAVKAVQILILTISAALFSGCGDTFRPTINVQPSPTGDPGGTGQAVIVSTNPVGNGADTHINVSGDTNVGQVIVGPNPLFMGKGGGSGRLFVINSNNSATVYTALAPQFATVNSIGLPSGASGPIGGGFDAGGDIFIANSGSNNLTFISSSQVVASSQLIPVGAQPVTVAGGPGATKVYSINHGANTVTAIFAQDNSVGATIAVGSQPVWGTMTPDGLFLYVVNQGSGTVSVIDTIFDVVIATITVGSSPNFAFFDPGLQRVYVTNTGSATLSVIKGDNVDVTHPPFKLADIPLSGPAVSVAVLPNGTKAYAALGGCPAGINHTSLVDFVVNGSCLGNRLSVIDAAALRESKVLTLGSGVVSVDSSIDSNRVYAVNAHDGNISIIKTFNDTELTNSSGQPSRMSVPPQNASCTNPAVCPPNLLQTPFQVLTFP